MIYLMFFQGVPREGEHAVGREGVPLVIRRMPAPVGQRPPSLVGAGSSVTVTSASDERIAGVFEVRYRNNVLAGEFRAPLERPAGFEPLCRSKGQVARASGGASSGQRPPAATRAEPPQTAVEQTPSLKGADPGGLNGGFWIDSKERHAKARETVQKAVEGLPPASRDEAMTVHRDMEARYISDYQDPACMTLRYLEWRRDNPDTPVVETHAVRVRHPDTWREWLEACPDRERIVEVQTRRTEYFLDRSPTKRHTEEQRDRIAACVGETVTDRYAANPAAYSSSRRQSGLHTNVMIECRRQLGPPPRIYR